VNYCFLKSYGPDSWEREKHEGRFTFTAGQIKAFVKECGCRITHHSYEKDEFYKDTLPNGVYNALSHTGTILVCERI